MAGVNRARSSVERLTVQESLVTISPEGVRASAVDMAFDAEGTAWLLGFKKARGYLVPAGLGG